MSATRNKHTAVFLRRSNGAAAHDITKHFCMPTEKALGSKTGLKKEIYHSLTLGAMGITTHTAALTLLRNTTLLSAKMNVP